jgi:hypothetical protein
MPTMRALHLLALVTLSAAAPLAAQGFEGTIVIKMADARNGGSMQLTYMIKGDKMAVVIPMSDGKAAGKDMRMIMDNRTHKAVVLMPSDGMGASKGMMMTMDMDKITADAAKGAPPEIKDLGTIETIAGYKCEDFAVTQKGEVTTMCISRDLGTFVYPTNPMARGSSPDWIRALGNKPGFPLKVTSSNRKESVEVVSIQKGSVPADAFTIPEGYMDASGIGSMFGRGGRGGPQH